MTTRRRLCRILPNCRDKKTEMFDRARSLVATAAVLVSALLLPSSVAADKPIRGQITKSPLITLNERQTATLSIVPVSPSRETLNVRVAFFDDNGRRLAVQRGTVAKGQPAFVARLSHDDLGRLDPALIRAEVRLSPNAPIRQPFSCPSAISLQTSDGPVIAWRGETCDCGPGGVGGVFAQCIGGPPQVFNR